MQPEAQLVAATQEALPGGRWLTFKIYERSAQSLDERPIPLELTFDFDESPGDREAFQTWRKYGKPVEIAASITADLPGGLGGRLEAGRVQLSPAEGEVSEFRNRLRLAAPDGIVLADLTFTMSATTGLDGTGAWTQGLDESGTLAIESLVDATAMNATVKFTVKPLAEREAAKVASAVLFASHLSAPNLLQMAGEYGNYFDFAAISISEPLVEPALARFVQALSTIQAVTSTPMVIPDVAEMDPDAVRAVHRAASLIGGHTTVGTWRPFTIERHPDIAFELGGHYQVAVIEPLTVSLNRGDLVLGSVEKKALSATVEALDGDQVRFAPHLNHVLHSTFLPEIPDAPQGKQVVRYRPAPEAEEAPACDRSS